MCLFYNASLSDITMLQCTSDLGLEIEDLALSRSSDDDCDEIPKGLDKCLNFTFREKKRNRKSRRMNEN